MAAVRKGREMEVLPEDVVQLLEQGQLFFDGSGILQLTRRVLRDKDLETLREGLAQAACKALDPKAGRHCTFEGLLSFFDRKYIMLESVGGDESRLVNISRVLGTILQPSHCKSAWTVGFLQALGKALSVSLEQDGILGQYLAALEKTHEKVAKLSNLSNPIQ